MKKRYLLGALLCLTMMGCNQLEPVTSTTPNTSHTSTSKGTSSASTSQDDTALKTAKEAAKEYLQGIVDNADVEDKSQLNSKLISIFNNIEKCKTVEDVESVKTKGASSLNELIEILTVSEGTREVKENAIAELNTIKNDKANDSRYDEDGIAEINEYINTALTTINSATSNEAIEATLESAKAAINAVKTKTNNFYDKMIKHRSSTPTVDCTQYFSFENEKIVSQSVQDGETGFYMGSQSGNDCTVVDLDITPNYVFYGDDTYEWSNISIRFAKWDESTNGEIVFKEKSTTVYSNAWSDTEAKKVSTTLELANNIALTNGVKHNIKIIRRGWDKKILIDNQTLIKLPVDGTLCGGYFEITTWSAGYTIENAFYKEYSSMTDFDASSYFSLVW